MRLKDIRTFNLGIRTLNDFARHFNNGTVDESEGKDIASIEYGAFEIILNIDSEIIITVKPKSRDSQ